MWHEGRVFKMKNLERGFRVPKAGRIMLSFAGILPYYLEQRQQVTSPGTFPFFYCKFYYSLARLFQNLHS